MTPDTAPVTVREYFEAVDSRDVEAAERCFSVDAMVATPSAGAESGARVVRRTDEFVQDLANRGPVAWRHRLLAAHTSGAVSIVEGELVDRRTKASLYRFLVVLETDRKGRISSFRSFRQGVRAKPAPTETRVAWIDVLRNAAAERGASPSWLDAGLTPRTRLSLPPVPLPATGGVRTLMLSIEPEAVALCGRVGDLAEFCVVARGVPGGAVDQIDAYWCHLSASEVDSSEWSTQK